MNVFTMVTVVAIVAIVAEMIKSLANAKTKNANTKRDTQQFEQEIDQLKDRVAALEAIVTDKNYDLSKEIDKL